MKALKYAAVVEKAAGNYSAYVPDLHDCVAVGDTREEVERNIREALAFHLDGMREDGIAVPEPEARTLLIEAQI
ncbi:MAG: type II toxin-antitoxin system HicB family antitoxin [Dehalococcoidia bacterium]|nr:type II toxin-antitoxin system HicB family antitoxin [Dehalococcoidia bacterium]